MQETTVLEKIQMLPLPLDSIVYRAQHACFIDKPGAG